VFECRVNQRLEDYFCSCYQQNDEDRDGPRNVGLLTIQPPDADASPRIFYWIQSLWKL